MNVIDYSATREPEPVKHHPLLPNSIRMIIIGPSGSGKTQLLIDMIMRHMKWDKLYLIAPSVDDQRCYQVLKDFNERIVEITGENGIEFITDMDEAPSVDDLDREINNLVVYDDVMLDKQTNPARIFSRGRHKNADVIYVTQKYSQIPCVIRENCNLVCIFSGIGKYTLQNIYQYWFDGDMDFNQFRTFVACAKRRPHGFVTINMNDPRAKYRIGLDQIWKFEEFHG